MNMGNLIVGNNDNNKIFSIKRSPKVSISYQEVSSSTSNDTTITSDNEDSHLEI